MKRLPSLMIRLGMTPILALLTLIVLAGPDHVQAQECDYSILDTTDDDPAFFYGIGDGASRMRQLARSQSMALARSDLALKYQAEVVALVQNAMEQVGFDNPTLAAATSATTVQFTQAYVTDSRVTNSHTCREGSDWHVFLVMQVEKGNILDKLVEEVEAQLQENIETGDAAYSREQTDKLFEQVNDELEKRRSGGDTSPEQQEEEVEQGEITDPGQQEEVEQGEITDPGQQEEVEQGEITEQSFVQRALRWLRARLANPDTLSGQAA